MPTEVHHLFFGFPRINLELLRWHHSTNSWISSLFPVSPWSVQPESWENFCRWQVAVLDASSVNWKRTELQSFFVGLQCCRQPCATHNPGTSPTLGGLWGGLESRWRGVGPLPWAPAHPQECRLDFIESMSKNCLWGRWPHPQNGQDAGIPPSHLHFLLAEALSNENQEPHLFKLSLVFPQLLVIPSPWCCNHVNKHN